MGRRLEGLDLLRGLAALGVAFMHLQAQYKLTPFWGELGLAVDFFFMLSGFVMARTYEHRLRASTLTPIAFVGLRFKRLWLVMAVGTLIGLPIALVQYPLQNVLPALLLAMLMLPAIGTGFAPFPFNGPAWSIFYEIAGNAVHAIILAKMRTGTLWAIFVLVSVAVTAYYFRTGQWPRGTHPDQFIVTFLRFFSPYILGILIFRHLGDRSVRWSWFFFPAILLLALPFSPIVALLVLFPSLLLFGLKFPEIPHARVSGALSYPLYATHMPTMEFVRILGGTPTLAFSIVVLIAVLTTWLIERPRYRRAVQTNSANAQL